MAFDAVDFCIDRNDKLGCWTSAALSRDAKLEVGQGVTAVLRGVSVHGAKIRSGVWSGADCDWIEGGGSLALGAGLRIVLR